MSGRRSTWWAALVSLPLSVQIAAAGSGPADSDTKATDTSATGNTGGEPGIYAVPAGCPSADEWRSALRQRLPPLLRTHPLIEALSVHIEKVQSAGNTTYMGELGPLAGAPDTARAVHGASCQEVVAALSFIGALGLERAARLDAGPAPADGPAAPETRPQADARLDAAATAAHDSPQDSSRLGVTGFALFQSGLVPGSSIALGASLSLSWRASGWQPWASWGAYVSLPEERPLAGGSVRFEHWSTHAVGCPWRFPARGLFGLRPCVELDLGRTSGEGLGVLGATRRSAPWLSAGAQLRAELSLGQWLELGAALAGVAPFWHSRFFLEPDLTSFETPTLGYRAEAYANVPF